MHLRGGQIIGSAFTQPDGPVFAAVNPATGKTLQPQFFESTRADVERAVSAAAAAFEPYRKLPMRQRAAFLDGIGEQLTALGADLVSRAHEETALPRPRLEAELLRTVNQLRLFAQEVRQGSHLQVRIDRAAPHRLPVAKPDIRTMQVPLGPVAVFGASNFPLAFSVAGGDTASALAAGCPVVVKGHPAHPGTSELAGQAVIRAVQEHSIPAGTFSLLQANQAEAGVALVQHPLIKAVAFTGSLAVGRALFDLASARPEPIQLHAEMGSVNPVFLLPQILADKGEVLATELVESMTLGVGQFCTAPGLILVMETAGTTDLLHKMASCLEAKPPGVMLHAGIKQNFLAGLEKLSAQKGVQRCGDPRPMPGGCRVAPALMVTRGQALIDNPTLAEEVFGPAALVVICASGREMLAAAESLQGQLTASIHGTTKDFAEFSALLDLLQHKAGRLIMNGFPTGVEVCPAMHHGGPYPATTDSRCTSVGTEAMKRFLRPVCYQNCPQELLPEPLRDENTLRLWRLLDGSMSREDL